jgi:hypothetical protein
MQKGTIYSTLKEMCCRSNWTYYVKLTPCFPCFVDSRERFSSFSSPSSVSFVDHNHPNLVPGRKSLRRPSLYFIGPNFVFLLLMIWNRSRGKKQKSLLSYNVIRTVIPLYRSSIISCVRSIFKLTEYLKKKSAHDEWIVFDSRQTTRKRGSH